MAELEITCDNCEHSFRIDEDEEPIRCPECNSFVDHSATPSEDDEEEPDVPPVSGSNPVEDEFTEPDRSRHDEPAEARADESRAASDRQNQPDPGTESSRFSVTTVISTSFELFFKDFASFVGLGAIILSPMLLVTLVMLLPGLDESAMTVSWFTNMFGGLVLTPLLSGAMMYGVIRKLNNKSFEISECISEAISILLPLIGLSFLQGLIIGFGVVLCLIPGLVAATMLYVCIPVLVIEQTGVIDALKRSYDLTSGNLLRIFGIIVILFLINFSLGFFVRTSTVGFGLDPNQALNMGMNMRLYLFFNTILSVLSNTLTSITIATSYYYLRLDQEGTTLDELVHLFD